MKDLGLGYLFEIQDELSLSGCKTIGGFMVKKYGYEYNSDKVNVEIEQFLNETMAHDGVRWTDK